MYKFDEKYVKVSSYDIYLALDYIEKNNIEDEKIKDKIDQYTNELVDAEYVKVEECNPMLVYILEMYKSELNLQMIQNSILWSIVNIKNDKKFELEFLYKTVMLEKLKTKKWTDELENQLILKLLKDNLDLYEYIIYTQSINDYMEDNAIKGKCKQKLKNHLKK